MRKTFYYNFFPTKAEEEALKTSKEEFKVTRTIVKIQDIVPPPEHNPANPWKILKQLTARDIVTGKLILSHEETFEHIFRHWSVQSVNKVVQGEKVLAMMWDLTDDRIPRKYCGEGTFLSKVPDEDFYVFGWSDVARDRYVMPGHEIGLFWNPRFICFVIKVFNE